VGGLGFFWGGGFVVVWGWWGAEHTNQPKPPPHNKTPNRWVFWFGGGVFLGGFGPTPQKNPPHKQKKTQCVKGAFFGGGGVGWF